MQPPSPQADKRRSAARRLVREQNLTKREVRPASALAHALLTLTAAERGAIDFITLFDTQRPRLEGPGE
jgi:hypothetical protein